jgi:nucleoside-diphosphate-sugar epimerase
MKVLITGHEGFVGREFCRQLEGHDIVGVDLKSGKDCRQFFAEDHTRFDLVVHLAAVVGGRMKIDGAPLEVATDLAIDSDMFNWAMRTRPDRIIYYSSSAAYRVDIQTRQFHRPQWEEDIDLSDVRTPDQTYGWSKLTGEILAKYATEAGLKVHVFRPFSGYGLDQDRDYPFPSFIDRALRRDDPFQIWGDGTQQRDFIHIFDVVAASLEAVRQNIEGPTNLGWGRATSFNELAAMVCKEAGYSPQFEHLTANPVGCWFRVSNSDKMKSFYKPRICLEEGIWAALAGKR